MLARVPRAAYEAAMIEPAQIRAARALLGWTMDDLSGKAGVSLASIKNIERGATDPKVSTLQRIQTALEGGGLVFLDAGDTKPGGKGVRFR